MILPVKGAASSPSEHSFIPYIYHPAYDVFYTSSRRFIDVNTSKRCNMPAGMHFKV